MCQREYESSFCGVGIFEPPLTLMALPTESCCAFSNMQYCLRVSLLFRLKFRFPVLFQSDCWRALVKNSCQKLVAVLASDEEAKKVNKYGFEHVTNLRNPKLKSFLFSESYNFYLLVTSR